MKDSGQTYLFGTKYSFFFNKQLGGYVVEANECESDELIIPSYIDGVKVKAVHEECNNSYSKIIVLEDNTEFMTIDGVLFSRDGTQLLLYPPQKKDITYTIPAGVTKIAEEAIPCNHYLEKLIFPKGFWNIDQYSICCRSLKEVFLPYSIKHIGYAAFKGNTNLKDIFYEGTGKEWCDIVIGDQNECLLDAIVHFIDGNTNVPILMPETKNIISKSIKEIIIRAIVLECLSCCCWLDEVQNNFQGDETKLSENRVSYGWLNHFDTLSVDGSNDRRESVFKWLKDRGYSEYLTDVERYVFEKKTDRIINYAIYYPSEYHYALEVLLWSVGLIENLLYGSSYEIHNYHDLLKIYENHKLEDILSSCHKRDDSDLEREYTRTRYWYWLLTECREITDKEQVLCRAEDFFGREFILKITENGIIDDLDWNKKTDKCNQPGYRWYNLLKHIKIRYRTFTWILNDDNWGNYL